MKHHRFVRLRERWVRESTESDLPLCWMVEDVRQALAEGASESEIRAVVLEVLRPGLESGELQAVDLLPGGEFRRWVGSVEEQLQRIEFEWMALGHFPNLGEVVWFVGRNRVRRIEED